MSYLIKAGLKCFGKSYVPDSALPAGYICRFAFQRMIWLIRGFLRMGKPIFLASGVILENRRNIALGRHATIERNVRINAVAHEKVFIGDNARIGAYSQLLCTVHLSRVGKSFRLGAHSSCGEFCFFGAAGGIDIGDHVIMGQYVSFHAQNHNFGETGRLIREQGTSEKGISIGDDCWIGAKVTFLDGARIGRHCVIAACACVSGEFPDHSLIAGIPARVIRTLKEPDKPI